MAFDPNHWTPIEVAYADTRGYYGQVDSRYRARAAYLDGKFWLRMQNDEFDSFDLVLNHEQMAALIQHVLETDMETD